MIKKQENQKNLQAISSKKCPKCGKEVDDPNYKRCNRCRNIQKIYIMRYLKKIKILNFKAGTNLYCTNCGKKKEDWDMLYRWCFMCRHATNTFKKQNIHRGMCANGDRKPIYKCNRCRGCYSKLRNFLAEWKEKNRERMSRTDSDRYLRMKISPIFSQETRNFMIEEILNTSKSIHVLREKQKSEVKKNENSKCKFGS